MNEEINRPTNLGGHLPDPPDDCVKKEFIFIYDNDGRKHIDLGICQITCKPLCLRAQSWIRAQNTREKEKEVIKNKVIL